MRTLASNPADSDFAVLARHQLHHRRPLQCLKLFQFASFDFFGQIAGRSYDSFPNLWINMKDIFTLHCNHSKKIRLDFRTSDLVGLDGGLHGRPRPRQGRLCPSRLMAGSIGQKGYNISYIFYLERRNRISRPYFFVFLFYAGLSVFPFLQNQNRMPNSFRTPSFAWMLHRILLAGHFPSCPEKFAQNEIAYAHRH